MVSILFFYCVTVKTTNFLAAGIIEMINVLNGIIREYEHPDGFIDDVIHLIS